MPFKGPLEFDSADEFGSEESGGDEQEDDVGFVEPPDDLGSPFLAGNDLTVAPVLDVAPMAQSAEVVVERAAQFLVLSCVGDEYRRSLLAV